MKNKNKLGKAISTIAFLALAAIAGFGFSVDDDGTPEVPCDEVRVPAGNQLQLRAYAIGVQKYTWNGSDWVFTAPEAGLFADKDYRGKIGTHYGGPTWESANSYVVATRANGCDPDPANAIPLLLLKRKVSGGGVLFSRVTYIQRLNTVGGVKPSAPGSHVGEEKRVPYTADYYFYKIGYPASADTEN